MTYTARALDFTKTLAAVGLLIVAQACTTAESARSLSSPSPTPATAPTAAAQDQTPEVEPTPSTTGNQSIALTTDREFYHAGDTAQITLANHSSHAIWIDGETNFWILQRQAEDGGWVETPITLPSTNPKTGQLDCILNLAEPSPPAALPAGSSTQAGLTLSELCEWPLSPIGLPKTEPAVLPRGEYRFATRYALDPAGPAEKEANSAPFRIEN